MAEPVSFCSNSLRFDSLAGVDYILARRHGNGPIAINKSIVIFIDLHT